MPCMHCGREESDHEPMLGSCPDSSGAVYDSNTGLTDQPNAFPPLDVPAETAVRYVSQVLFGEHWRDMVYSFDSPDEARQGLKWLQQQGWPLGPYRIIKRTITEEILL